MERDFTYLKEKYSIAGAREKFEDICAEVLGLEYGCETHQIRVTRGDGGIDVMVGDFSAPIHNFQCKFFLDGLGDSQKAQIRESLSTAAKNPNFTMKEWTLCVPLTLSSEEMAWWSGRKTAWQNEFGIKVSLHDKEYLLGLLKKHGIYERVFDLRAERVMDKLEEFLDGERPAAQTKQPNLNLPLPMTMDEDKFIGREKELADIKAKLKKSSVVYLTGLGGMGKTELAIKFGREYRDGEVYFVRFQESFQRTVSMNVAQGIEGLLEQGPEVAYAEAMKRLGQCSKHDILIIDNADEPSGNFANLKDNTWTALRQLPMKLLITTRCEVAGAVQVGAMETKLLRQLFQNQESPLKEKQMDDLIDAVRGHTMMVDMMAKTLRRNRRLTAEHLLQTIKDGTLPAERLRAIAIEKNGNTEQEQIYVHLKNLFSMAELNEMDKDILGDLVLLPEAGVDMAVLDPVYTEEEWERLEQLIDAGWLNLEPKTKRVTMHPVVRLVCREELKPDDENCGNFLKVVSDQYDPKRYDAALFRQWAELFSQAADILPDREGSWATRAGYFWNELVQSDNALKYNQLAVERREENMPDSKELATAYNNVGLTYSRLGDHQKTLEYTLKALAICEKVLPPEHPSLAAVYNNVGSTYGNLGDHQKALEYKLKALAIYEKVLPPEHPDLATSYDNVGSTYGDLGDHQKELEYELKALAIREKVLPPAHPDLAISYNNVGGTYGDLGDHQKALELKLKALAILEKVLPPEHPNLAISYNNVGLTYGALSDHQKELEYHQKALAIRKKVLLPEHPSLATSYNNVGLTYGALSDHKKALEYKLKALAIRKKVLPPEHPDLATSYNNVGSTYLRLGDHQKALEYKLKALAIREKVLPPEHPDLAQSYNNVGYTYGALGDHQKALEYQLKALAIFEKALPPEHPDLAISYINVGYTYGEMGDYETALDYTKRAVAIGEKSLPEGHPRTENYRQGVLYWTYMLAKQNQSQ